MTVWALAGMVWVALSCLMAVITVIMWIAAAITNSFRLFSHPGVNVGEQKAKSDLHTIVIAPGPLNTRAKPSPFQQGGIFGCFAYVPGLGWIDRNLLMLLAAGWGVIGALLIPQVAIGIRMSSETMSRNNLGALRLGLDAYRRGTEGQYPVDLAALTVGGRYLTAIPPAKSPNYHLDSIVVKAGSSSDDGGGWLYDGVSSGASRGRIFVNCTHTDSKGTVWSSY